MYKITASYDGTDTVIHGRLDPNARVSGAVLKEAVNVIPTFSFTIYPNNPGYEMMQDMLTGISVRDRRTGETIFKGRVYSVSDMMDATGQIYKNVTCEGELSYLCDTIQPPRRFSGMPYQLSEALPTLLSEHNSHVGSSKQIQLGNISGGFADVYEGEYKSTFEMVKAVCEMAGCEFRLRHSNGVRYLDAAPSLGTVSDTEIVFAVNLRSLQKTEQTNDIVTRFYPLGAANPGTGNRLTIQQINGGKKYIQNDDLYSKYGIIEASKIYDIAPTDWADISAVTAAINKLFMAGNKDYEKMTAVLTSFSIEALDLSLINGDYDSLRIYNTYRVRTKLQGIDEEVRLTGRTLELDNPQNPTLTFGQKQTTLTSMIAGQ